MNLQLHDIFFFLVAALWFVIGVSLIIVVHELGHFGVARVFGVAVEKVVFGFGRPLFRVSSRRTVYVFRAIPFGGYVQLKKRINPDVHDSCLERMFDESPVLIKILITLGGPLANMLLAAVLFGVLAVQGLDATEPVLAKPVEGSLADQAGVDLGDRVVGFWSSTAGESPRLVPVNTFSDLSLLIKRAVVMQKEVVLAVQKPALPGELQTASVRLDFARVRANQPEWRIMTQVGLSPAGRSTFVRSVKWRSAAELAGIEPGDQILSLNGMAVSDPSQIQSFFGQISESRPVLVQINRRGVERELQVMPLLQARDDGFRVRPLARLGVSFVEDHALKRVGGRLGDGDPSLKDYWQGFERHWQHVGDHFSVLFNQSLVQGPSLSQMFEPFVVRNHVGKSLFYGFSGWLFYLGAASLALAAFNLLPLPTLDGSRLLLFVCEGANGSPLSPGYVQVYHRLVIAWFMIIVYVAFANEVFKMAGPKVGLSG